MLHDGPIKWASLPNTFYCLALLAVMYVLAAHIHIGSSLQGLGDSKLRQLHRESGEKGQESLQHTILSLEVENKRLQELMKESEALIKKDKDLMVLQNTPTKVSAEDERTVDQVEVDKVKYTGPRTVIQHSHSIDPKRETISKKTAVVKKSASDASDFSLKQISSPSTNLRKNLDPGSKSLPVKTNDKSESNEKSSVLTEEGPHSNSFILDSTVSGSSQGIESKETRAMMVVCGTDGSGTRSVVQTLTKLGVLMTSEDPETYDIHGDLMGGWPTMVKPVISNTHSLDYDPNKINPMVHKVVSDGLRRLVAKAERDSHKPESFKLAVGGALKRTPNADATRVQFGFKAPVAMTLAPYWAYLAPKFKLLHVLRDGRDIAFSANQGPVQKFYADMYGPNHKNVNSRNDDNPRVKAIRLWSDWNTQLRAWSEKQASALRSQSTSDDRSFSYISIHTEDLASTDVHVRYRAISDLARWVGSTLDQEAICCIAQEGATFMGSHDRTDKAQVRNQAQEVSRRYGKWRSLVARDKGLQDSFNRVGGAALRLFRYEGKDQVHSNDATMSDFSCPNKRTPASVEKCSRIFPSYSKA